MAKIKSTVEYAHRLHEHMYKNYTEPGTGPTYLEEPVMDHKVFMGRVIRYGVQIATMTVFA